MKKEDIAKKMKEMFAPRPLTKWEQQREHERGTKTGWFHPDAVSQRVKELAEHKERVRAHRAKNNHE